MPRTMQQNKSPSAPKGERTESHARRRPAANPPRPNARPSQSGGRRGGNPRPLSPEERARRQRIDRARREEEQRHREEQLAYEKRMKERKKAIRKKEWKQFAKIALGRILVFLILLVFFLLLAVGALLISFHRAPQAPADHGRITYYYGGEEVRKVPVETALQGKEAYFCFNDLSAYLEMSEGGTAAEMKFILPKGGILPETAAGDGSEQFVIFLSDTSKVIVNGQMVEMDVPSLLRGTEIWVSLDFVADYMQNVSFTYSEKKQEVRISRIKDEAHSTDNLTIYLHPTFTLQNADPIPSIQEDPLIGDLPISSDPDATGGIVLTFLTDLSDYESYMNPTGDMRDAFLVLAGEREVLSSSYVPASMVEVPQKSVISDTQYLSAYAAKALDALYKELRAAEFYSMAVYKSYVSYADQSVLFEGKVEELMQVNNSLTRSQAEKNAAAQVCRPGTDDHQTGLAVDMDTFGCVTTDFQYEAEYTWLQENAWKFGFILRYPKDKTDETGHAFEPWHYRYVGRYHAQKIHASGLCLEEYLEQLK